MEKIWRFIKDEDGLELSEYAVIGAIVIGVGSAIYLTLATSITTAIQSLINAMAPAGPAA